MKVFTVVMLLAAMSAGTLVIGAYALVQFTTNPNLLNILMAL